MSKFLSVLLCVSLLLAAVSCAPPSDQQPQNTYEAQKALYDDIISQYTALLTAKHTGEELPVPNTDDMDEREAAIADALYGIVNRSKSAETVKTLGYGYKDFDGNGTPELVLLTQSTAVLAIFTISDNMPILLESRYCADDFIAFASNQRFFMSRINVNGAIKEVTYCTCRIDGDKMVYDSVYGEVYDQEKNETVERFQMLDGNRTSIDKKAFDELYREQSQIREPGYSDILKLRAPRIYYPLADRDTNENLPVADFSDYAAILKTYKEISTCLDEFKSYDWFMGKYDGLFTFPNDTSFEYYSRLLYAAYHNRGCVGYDEIDLNGDGKNELVLMNEDYRIRAIFTQKDGQPVLLDAFSSETCWLDDQGFIHVDREDYDELEYSLYEFTKDSEYKLIYSILATKDGRYLTKDGKTEQITFEKSLEIYYDDYCRYSEPFVPNEQTRNVSDLTFTPMAEASESLIQSATAKTWYKYANFKPTPSNEWGSFSNTYVSFENATNTQMTVQIKYVYTSFYLDPDRENYLLDDTTESFLNITAYAEDDVFVFDEQGLKGRLDFGQECLWLIIEESTDQRFPAGNHCYKVYSPEE